MTKTKDNPTAKPINEKPGPSTLRKLLKKQRKKTFDNPMKMERSKEGFRSKNPGVKFMDEMDAMTKGLDTLTSKGPGKLKVGKFAKGGRAGYKVGGAAKKGVSKILRKK